MIRTARDTQRFFRFATLIATPTLCALHASAQQFVQQVGMVPGVARWSEGVECADVDNDGDLDIFFADGEGFSSASAKRQNVLLINQFIPSGTLAFTDESVARLGANLSNAKGVVTCDVNGDGWVDALYCNAFGTDVPFLYMNQGPANPGFFALESATRGFTVARSSASAQFGDIDDDGDADLILNDAYLGSAAGKPHLFVNDGTGHFVENAAKLPGAVNKSAQMDVQFADLDNDWDLDFFGACRAPNAGVSHYLLFNDGAGSFANTTVQVPSASSSTYEGEVGDLDGDDDIDLFLVSTTGLAEGAIRNNKVPSGTMGLTQLAALADGNDDNEIALFDYDVDGDYDVIVGSLGGNSEAFWRNNGGFSFTNESATKITQLFDPTLDCTVADLNNDGRYDLVTAQGESNAAQWANKIYRNTGAIDALRPRVVAVDTPVIVAPSAAVKVHAKVRDQVMDDGVSYVRGEAHYTIRSVPFTPSTIAISAGGVAPPLINVSAGQSVRFDNQTAGSLQVVFTSTPYDFSTPSIGSGSSYEQTLIHPGTYGYSVAGFTGQIVVGGADTTVAATYSGGGLYRFWMPDTANGAGSALFYELEFRDWAGNRVVTAPAQVALLNCTPSVYCTAKTNSAGCVPQVAFVGTPDSTAGAGFTISATSELNQQFGLFYFGVNGPAALPFQGGFQCVAAPRYRLPLMFSNGSGVGSDCSGSYSLDFNAYMAGPGSPITWAPGWVVSGQFWSRDPADPSTTNLSNAVRFSICQ